MVQPLTSFQEAKRGPEAIRAAHQPQDQSDQTGVTTTGPISKRFLRAFFQKSAAFLLT
jgi:hypothetical protein